MKPKQNERESAKPTLKRGKDEKTKTENENFAFFTRVLASRDSKIRSVRRLIHRSERLSFIDINR